MGLKRRIVAGLAAGALLLGVAVSGLAGAAPVPAGAAPVQQRGSARTVTMITGDRVTVWGDTTRVSVEPGPGRQDVMFATQTDAGRVRVVPSDAAPLLAAGRLDSRLFDVTMLLEFGYDRRDRLPLIVTGGRGTGAAAAGAARASVAGVDGLAVARELPAVAGVAVTRTGDTVDVGVPMHTDGHGRPGDHLTGARTTILYATGSR